ncbi:AcrR family transcriptional regulator [Bradyrhizobium diazoefficiens]
MTATTRRARKERTRQRLVEAAIKLFAEAGYANTSVDRIAEEAGCTKGAFYTSFKKGKEEILLEAIRADQDERIDALTTDITRAAESAEIIGLLVAWAGEKSASGRLSWSLIEQARLPTNVLLSLGPYKEAISRKWQRLGASLSSRFPHLAHNGGELGALLYQIAYVPVPSHVSRSNSADIMQVALEGLLRVRS